MGIAGAGMTALAILLRERGHEVTGSDPAITPGQSEMFKRMGIAAFPFERSESIEGKEMVVISSAIRGDHVELRAALKKEIPIWHRVDLLVRLAEGKKLLAVAGTHGKGTTAAMLAHILENQQCFPSLANGADLINYGRRAWWGNGEYFVMETDESDGSFLKLNPWASIITNIDRDHLSFWGSLENLTKGFRQFASQVRGPLVVCDEVRELNLPGKTIRYGEDPESTFYVDSLREAEGGTTTMVRTRREKVELFVPLWGRHNALNAVGAMALASFSGIDSQESAEALRSFKGIRRRLERKGEAGGILIVDDHADHPTEISRSISALLPLGRPIVAVIQPHRFSRVRSLLTEYGPAFAGCRIVIVLPIFSAGESLSFQLTGREVFDVIHRELPEKEIFFSNPAELFKLLKMKLKKGDALLFLGPGDIASLADQAFRRLHE